MGRGTKLIWAILGASVPLLAWTLEASSQPLPGWVVGPGDPAGEPDWTLLTLHNEPVIDGDLVTFRSTAQQPSGAQAPPGIYQHQIGGETRQLQRDSFSQPHPYHTNLAQDGARVAYGTFNADVVLVPEADPLALPEVLGSASFLGWVSLDGGTAAWVGGGPNALYVRTPADAAQRSVTHFAVGDETVHSFGQPSLRGDSLATIASIHAQRGAALLVGTDLTTATPLFYIWFGDGVPRFEGTDRPLGAVSQLAYDGRYVAFSGHDPTLTDYAIFRKDTEGGAAGELVELARRGDPTPGREDDYAFIPFSGGLGLFIPCIDSGNVVFTAGSALVEPNPDLPAQIGNLLLERSARPREGGRLAGFAAQRPGTDGFARPGPSAPPVQPVGHVTRVSERPDRRVPGPAVRQHGRALRLGPHARVRRRHRV